MKFMNMEGTRHEGEQKISATYFILHSHSEIGISTKVPFYKMLVSSAI
jgi:hypothetical protein